MKYNIFQQVWHDGGAIEVRLQKNLLAYVAI